MTLHVTAPDARARLRHAARALRGRGWPADRAFAACLRHAHGGIPSLPWLLGRSRLPTLHAGARAEAAATLAAVPLPADPADAVRAALWHLLRSLPGATQRRVLDGVPRLLAAGVDGERARAVCLRAAAGARGPSPRGVPLSFASFARFRRWVDAVAHNAARDVFRELRRHGALAARLEDLPDRGTNVRPVEDWLSTPTPQECR